MPSQHEVRQRQLRAEKATVSKGSRRTARERRRRIIITIATVVIVILLILPLAAGIFV